MSIYHMCTTQQPCSHIQHQEGWIVVGVDNILEHFIIYTVCSHIKGKTGEWLVAKKSLILFFCLPTLGCIYYLLHGWGELESV